MVCVCGGLFGGETRGSLHCSRPPTFYGMWIREPQLLFKFSLPFFHGEVGNSDIFLQKEQSISSPQAVSALKTKMERKGAPW